MDIYTILLVDDDERNLITWEQIVSSNHRKVLKANSGYDALRKLVTEDIQLVITDIDVPSQNGPQLNGFELINRLKKDPRTKNVDVIFTVDEQETVSDIVEGLNDGAVDYLVEPLHPEITKAKVAVFERLFRKQLELAKEKRKVEGLLYNVLPKTTVDEIQKTGITTARHYQLATVMFTDFSGFTQISEKLSPGELLEKLNTYFSAFDKIAEAYHVEKIKTIGDAYMCAGGVPIRNKLNPVFTTLAAMKMRDYMVMVNKEQRKKGEDVLGIRIGLHSGPLVAGVVGSKRWQYDLWGDTVNTASRIESNGEVAKINITGDTFELIKDFFNCSYRGKIAAKHKGKIDMYFVDSIKKDFATIHNELEPNEAFINVLNMN